MFNVCPGCGVYQVEKDVRAETDRQAGLPTHWQANLPISWQALAICPACGYAHPFLRLPLFLITGASGTGKTALALALAAQDCTCVHLESDILWRPEFNHPEDDYRDYRNLWLRLCKNISQGGRPVALYGSTVPAQVELCPERRYFAELHYLALICDPRVLVERLRDRPAWRESGSAAFVENMLAFNRWFIENTSQFGPAMTLLDTSHQSVDESAGFVRQWLAERWSPPDNLYSAGD